MTEQIIEPVSVDNVSDKLKKRLGGHSFGKWSRFILAALGGIPVIGALLGAGASLWGETEQNETNRLLYEYVEALRHQIDRLGKTIVEITERLDPQYERYKERIESPAFLAMAGRGFRVISESDSEDKRAYVRKLLCNAATTSITSDDVVRLFLDWIEQYNDLHFRVIRALYKNEGLTRQGVWDEIHGVKVAENSAEADLFKLLMDDLSQGHVLRFKRDVDADGNFYKARPARTHTRSDRLKTAFDDEKPLELTELGKQFVRYTMEDMMPQLTS
jgi:hypothetical protein